MLRFILFGALTIAALRDVRAQSIRPIELPSCEEGDAKGNCILYKASIIQLLARPDIYHGKRVRVTGFIHFEFEGTGIYLHQEDYAKRLYSNGLWAELQKGARIDGKCQDRYVLVEGTFHSDHHGHLGLWSGAITDITRCINWN